MLLTTADSVSSVAQFLTVLFLFLFVVAITYVSTRFLAGIQKNRLMSGNIELVETLRISNNKYLQIVKVGNSYLVMAVCKDTITLLATMREEDLDMFTPVKSEPFDFKTVLSKAKGFYPGKNNPDKDEGN